MKEKKTIYGRRTATQAVKANTNSKELWSNKSLPIMDELAEMNKIAIPWNLMR